jgi:putative ABC transport system substrate-binding protein
MLLLAIGPAAVRAARAATSSIPIVSIDLESDPIHAGRVRSFARPGGNVTGPFRDLPDLTGKWLELLTEAVPQLTRIAILGGPTPGSDQANALKAAARGVEVQIVEVDDPEGYRALLARAMKARPIALVQLSLPLLNDPRAVKQIAGLTVQNGLPAISMFDQPSTWMSSSKVPSPMIYRSSVRASTVVNLRTARALGLTIPRRCWRERPG